MTHFICKGCNTPRSADDDISNVDNFGLSVCIRCGHLSVLVPMGGYRIGRDLTRREANLLATEPIFKQVRKVQEEVCSRMIG